MPPPPFAFRFHHLSIYQVGVKIVRMHGNKDSLMSFWGWKMLQTCWNLFGNIYIYIYIYKHTHTHTHTHTGCPRRNVPDFGRVFLMLKYTDITQNTYVQSLTVTEIMAREKCGLLAGPRTVPVSWQSYPCPPLSVVSYDGNSAHASPKLHMYFLQGDDVISRVTSVLDSQVSCIVLGTLKDNYDVSASVFVV